MSPSVWSRRIGFSLAAMVLALCQLLPASASVNLVAAWNVPSLTTSKICSRAFRYAAAAENGTIIASAEQLRVSIRQLIRMRDPRSAGSNTNFDAFTPRAVMTMCGTRW
jgi:hypothetical protein